MGRAALPSPLPGMRAARVTREFEPELDWTGLTDTLGSVSSPLGETVPTAVVALGRGPA